MATAMLALDRYPTRSPIDGIPDRPIVLIGSLGSTRSMWRMQREAFQQSGPVITIDLRGHGDSQNLDVATSIEDLAGDVLEALNQIGIERAHFVGVSLGGAICQQIAINHPERVDYLVLSCTAAKFGTPQMWQERAETVRAHGTAPLVDGVLSKWFTAPYVASHSDVVRAVRHDFLSTSSTGYARACEALANFDIRDRLAEISAPTLVIAGTEDGSTPPDVVHELAAGIPGAQWKLLEGGAHLLNIELAEQFNTVVRNHFEVARQQARRDRGRASEASAD